MRYFFFGLLLFSVVWISFPVAWADFLPKPPEMVMNLILNMVKRLLVFYPVLPKLMVI